VVGSRLLLLFMRRSLVDSRERRKALEKEMLTRRRRAWVSERRESQPGTPQSLRSLPGVGTSSTSHRFRERTAIAGSKDSFGLSSPQFRSRRNLEFYKHTMFFKLLSSFFPTSTPPKIPSSISGPHSPKNQSGSEIHRSRL